jgi:chromosome partitioning protein
MRRIALINQKGGVGKTTTVANLGAALALAGKRVVVVDLDPQANLTLYLGVELESGAASSYRVLTGEVSFGAALRASATPNLRLLPTDIDLSGAELELSTLPEREKLLRKALDAWRAEHRKKHPGEEPADYVLFDCPPSLGLLSLNALAAADEVFLVVQTQFLALQGMSKLVEVIELVKKELHPGLVLGGIVPCMYDSRMRLAREVLTELRRYFPEKVFRTPITANVKLAESPSFGKTIFEYAPDSIGARDFASLAHEVLTQEVLHKSPPEPAEPRRATRPSLAAVVQRVAASIEPVRPPVAVPPAAKPLPPVAPPAKVASVPAVTSLPKSAPAVAPAPAPAHKPPRKAPSSTPEKPGAPAITPSPTTVRARAPKTPSVVVPAPLAPAVVTPAPTKRAEAKPTPKPVVVAPPPAPAAANGTTGAPTTGRRPRTRPTPSS